MPDFKLCQQNNCNKSVTEQILTVKQIADYLKVNERTVYRMATAGSIPAFKVGASWRFKQTEIEQWIKDQHNQHD